MANNPMLWSERQLCLPVSRTERDRWLLMGLIGTAVGVLGFLIRQIINSLIKLKWNLVENYLQVRKSDIFSVSLLENAQCPVLTA